MAILVELTVENLAVIQAARLTFGPGLNVVTGETGAGKSLLVDALSAVLGGRSDRDLIRTGAERARIEATFRLSAGDSAVRTILEERGAKADDDGIVVLTRELLRGGKGVSRLNGRSAPAGVIRAVGGALVDVHGQGSQVSLAESAQQLALLDSAAGTTDQRMAVEVALAAVRGQRRELDGFARASAEASARRELLAFQLEEIEAVALRVGEEEALVRERDLLANAGAIREATATAYDVLYGGAGSATERAAEAAQALARTPDPTGVLAVQIAALEGAEAALMEAARELRAHGDAIDFEPAREEEIEARLEVIRRLTRKYGGTVDEVMAYAESAARELEALDEATERRQVLAEGLAAAKESAGTLAWALSEARAKAAKTLGSAVSAQLADLALENMRFSVGLLWYKAPDGLPAPNGERYAPLDGGIDEVEFRVATNVGEEPKPLAHVASGGETSRLMLAIASAMAVQGGGPTAVFDEIDSGVGGRTGDVVGRQLWALARTGQVLCVTHLSQIAAYADHHFRVEKSTVQGRTFAQVEPLGRAGRLQELGAMLGGVGSPELDSAARLLLEQATGHKLADTALVVAAG